MFTLSILLFFFVYLFFRVRWLRRHYTAFWQVNLFYHHQHPELTSVDFQNNIALKSFWLLLLDISNWNFITYISNTDHYRVALKFYIEKKFSKSIMSFLESSIK